MNTIAAPRLCLVPLEEVRYGEVVFLTSDNAGQPNEQVPYLLCYNPNTNEEWLVGPRGRMYSTDIAADGCFVVRSSWAGVSCE